MARRKLLDPPSDPVDMTALRASDEEDDFDATDDEDESEEYEDGEDADALNDPDVTNLPGGPKIGGGRGKKSDIFGSEADHAMGRATSPRLYGQAAQFPNCVQLRVWKWENGVPVGLGAIDATATEEDFIQQFITAMPRRGEARAQFRLRPIDIRGQELGQEVTIVISEHHGAIRRIREAEEEEREMRLYGRGGGRFGRDRERDEDRGSGGAPHQVIVEAPHSEGPSEVTGIADRVLDLLESERTRIREEDARRAQERIDLATNAAQGVQALTERAMKDESARAERALKAQAEQNQMMVTMLTANFQQQQSAMAQMAEMQRRADELRMQQERERSERERQATEDRIRREREELEERRRRDREEAEFRLRQEREEAQRRIETFKMEMELNRQREKEDAERKERIAREERERQDRLLMEERSRREEREAREAKEREELRIRREEREREEAREREAERQRQHELRVKEFEAQAQRDREHAEKMLAMAKLELEAKSNASNADPLGGALKFFGQLGVPKDEVLARVLGGGGAAKGEEEDDEKAPAWLAALPMVAGALGEMMKARGGAQPQRAAAAPVIPPQFVPGPVQNMPRPAMRPPPRPLPAPPPVAQQRPQPTPALVATRPVEDEPLPPMPEVPEVEDTPPPKPASLSEIANAAGMTLKQQKSARIALRALVKQMQSAEEEKWEDLIGTAIMGEIAIFHYVKAVTVRSAILETGADEAFAARVIAAMRQSSLVPEDLPYGDADGGEA